MASTIQLEHPLFLQLMSKDLLEIGAFGRIANINTVKTIALVCKQWQAWVYSPEGPFSLVEREIEVVRKLNLRWGPINKLNQLLTEQGRAWFNFVDNFNKKTEIPPPQNNMGINYINEERQTPLQNAIRYALNDLNNLPLITTLIERGADPLLSTNTYKFNSKIPNNHYVYVFYEDIFPHIT